LCVGSETKIKFIKVSLSHGNAVVAMKWRLATVCQSFLVQSHTVCINKTKRFILQVVT
jgi:hypothetical protein